MQNVLQLHFFLCLGCNAKCLVIAVLVGFFFFGRTVKVLLGTFYHSLLSKRVAKIGLVSLGTLKKVFVRIVP